MALSAEAGDVDSAMDAAIMAAHEARRRLLDFIDLSIRYVMNTLVEQAISVSWSRSE
ncbi:hypothetical protein GCM10011410_03090 [Hoyosella rhizosphaerae]|uniref:Uncharacterized protein n=1 Tax=Hoyosella rhizosphaerae TaxID=1755582 RepID=A0A916U060_9ACTN|nr:hypothetical protein GCM10011410_03090 [Hoyosella rhizosphaerae]